ncbi:Major Facilitator Superfamily protein [Micromonospora rhizosphaerae]|uniref:Major Facilitator Superfamily protein n=1 Tax=Micromonospora rhizosphaerae TaxID=568872 RepID=A0A1C6RDB2_9ACTN|nr:MFS transporter [Micromonospora rhizosphaerae]SCL15079.1 Major Facilitator Superfamily protein [Micromonospora rhizosphaerae]
MSWGTTRVLTNRNAGLYLGGVLVSGFGTSAMVLVAGIWVKALTGSSSQAGLVTLGIWGPTLVGPLIGVLADRLRRRPLLIGLHAAMAVLLPVLLLVDSAARIWLIFAVMTAYGVSIVLLDSAEAALVPSVVPGELLGDFNGLRVTINEGMKLIVPLVGAGLFAAYGGQPVALLDAATFLLAALTFTLIRVPEEPPPPPDRWDRQLADGVAHLRRHGPLRHLVLCAGVTMLLVGINGAVAYAVVDAGLHRPPEFNGVLATVQGVGSLLGGLAAGSLLRRFGDRRVTAAAIAVFAAGARAAGRALPRPGGRGRGGGRIRCPAGAGHRLDRGAAGDPERAGRAGLGHGQHAHLRPGHGGRGRRGRCARAGRPPGDPARGGGRRGAARRLGPARGSLGAADRAGADPGRAVAPTQSG